MQVFVVGVGRIEIEIDEVVAERNVVKGVGAVGVCGRRGDDEVVGGSSDAIGAGVGEGELNCGNAVGGIGVLLTVGCGVEPGETLDAAIAGKSGVDGVVVFTWVE